MDATETTRAGTLKAISAQVPSRTPLGTHCSIRPTSSELLGFPLNTYAKPKVKKHVSYDGQTLGVVGAWEGLSDCKEQGVD